jgi:hypothetical protein
LSNWFLFLSSFIFPLLFRHCFIPVSLAHVVSSQAYPNLLGTKRLGCCWLKKARETPALQDFINNNKRISYKYTGPEDQKQKRMSENYLYIWRRLKKWDFFFSLILLACRLASLIKPSFQLRKDGLPLLNMKSFILIIMHNGQVNASGQFCGMAEMVGPVDFNKNMNFWQQDKWNCFFPVKWHIIKDVPNPQFCHIILENNENKPVTSSRDTQEVLLWPF